MMTGVGDCVKRMAILPLRRETQLSLPRPETEPHSATSSCSLPLLPPRVTPSGFLLQSSMELRQRKTPRAADSTVEVPPPSKGSRRGSSSAAVNVPKPPRSKGSKQSAAVDAPPAQMSKGSKQSAAVDAPPAQMSKGSKQIAVVDAPPPPRSKRSRRSKRGTKSSARRPSASQSSMEVRQPKEPVAAQAIVDTLEGDESPAAQPSTRVPVGDEAPSTSAPARRSERGHVQQKYKYL